MTYEQFVKTIRDFGIQCFYEEENPKRTYDYFHNKKTLSKNDDFNEKLFIYNEWYTGGMTGGSCWSDGDQENYYQASSSPKEEFTDLTVILDFFCPQITYLHYRSLEKLIKNDSYSRDEYYGNTSDYFYEYLYLKELYDFLKERKYL